MGSNLQQILKQQFGFDQFRPGQEETIGQLLLGQSSLAIFPTGSGKSLCYQLTATQLPNLTLVVSPLLALMKDQLAFLQRQGIAAASIDSTQSYEQSQQVREGVRSGAIKILMVSVERFKNERFRAFIGSVPLSMLVIDEAHCISEWGHNFRPDYLKLPHYQQVLNIPLVLLLTATATKRVKLDMAKKFNILPAHIHQTGFYRNNLDLSVMPVTAEQKPQTLLQQVQQQAGAGIVYVTLQKTAETVAAALTQQGVNAVAFHAGLDNDLRHRIQVDFMADSVQVVVATIAFGMGIDKPNIRFVMHYDLPKSIENYSQEIGRAGRDGLASNCIMLANLDGINTLENFVYGDTPELSSVDKMINAVREETHDGRWELQIVSLSNACNIRQLPLKTLLVQLELQGILTPLFAYYAEIRIKPMMDEETIFSRFDGERQAFIRAIFASTEMKKIWGTLDMDALTRSYGCDRHRVVTALEYLHEKQCIVLESKRITEVFSVDEALLHKPALVQEVHAYFAEKEQKEVKRIGAIVRFFELDRCLNHNLALYFDDHASPERCGHCSVCRGDVAKLTYSQPEQWPSEQQLIEALQGFKRHFESTTLPVTTGAYCRFLAGIMVPLFSRNKVRQLPGFALCEQLRFNDILEKVRAVESRLE